MTRILFVCEGNICRSPMAEALLKEKLLQRGTVSVDVSSCGLHANVSTRAEPRLEAVIGSAYEHLREFKSRPISSGLLEQSDLILAMEERQVSEIVARFPQSKGKVHTVTSFVGESG